MKPNQLNDTYVNIFLNKGFIEKRSSYGLLFFSHPQAKINITYDPKGRQSVVIIHDAFEDVELYSGNSIREVSAKLDYYLEKFLDDSKRKGNTKNTTNQKFAVGGTMPLSEDEINSKIENIKTKLEQGGLYKGCVEEYLDYKLQLALHYRKNNTDLYEKFKELLSKPNNIYGEKEVIFDLADFDNTKTRIVMNHLWFARGGLSVNIHDLGTLEIVSESVSVPYGATLNIGNLHTIIDRAIFKGAKIKTLGNLETIGSHANFLRSEIEDLGKLKHIGGTVDFGESTLKSLGNLQTIGGGVRFYDSQIKDLGRLQTIGGIASFVQSQISDLGELQVIRGSVRFNGKITKYNNLKYFFNYDQYKSRKTAAKIVKHFEYREDGEYGKGYYRKEDAPKMKYSSFFSQFAVGGLTPLSEDEINSKIEDIKVKLEQVGLYKGCVEEYLDYKLQLKLHDRKINTDLYEKFKELLSKPNNIYGEKEVIFDLADFDNTKTRIVVNHLWFARGGLSVNIHDLGTLEIVSESVSVPYGATLNLGNLHTIIGSANFIGAKIKTLGNLETIGRGASFTRSEIEDLGKLKHIGGTVDFTESTLKSLGNLQTIGGGVLFRDSQIKDLGKLQTIGSSASFMKSQISDLGELQVIRGSVRFNGKITKYNNLKYFFNYDQYKSPKTAAKIVEDFEYREDGEYGKGYYRKEDAPKMKYSSFFSQFGKGGFFDKNDDDGIFKQTYQYIDLFEDYENMPPKIAKIINDHYEKEDDSWGNYTDTAELQTKIEKLGYTFDYGLDNEPYGLRPIGVPLNKLKGYEEFDDNTMQNGGQVNNNNMDKIMVVVNNDYDNPKYFDSFIVAKNYVMQYLDEADHEIIDAYGDSIFVHKNATKEDLEWLFGHQYSRGGRLTITEADIIEGAKFKTKAGIIYVVDDFKQHNYGTQSITHAILYVEGGKKGAFRNTIAEIVNFLNQEHATKIMSSGGKMGNTYLVMSETLDGKVINEKFDRPITHHELFLRYKQQGYTIVDSRIFEITNISVIDAFTEAVTELIQAKYHKKVNWSMSFVAFAIEGDKVVVKDCIVTTSDGNSYKVTPEDLIDSNYARGGTTDIVYGVNEQKVKEFLKKYPAVEPSMKVFTHGSNIRRNYLKWLRWFYDNEPKLGGRAEFVSSKSFGSKTFYKYDWSGVSGWAEVFTYVHKKYNKND